jgi:head-tail adaptor
MKTLGPKLRHRIAFAAPAIVRDSNGDRAQVFVPVAGLQAEPAEVLTGAGMEAVKSGQPVSSVAARITVRWRPQLAQPYGLRITHGAETYHVETHYNDPTGRRWITLVCQKGLIEP